MKRETPDEAKLLKAIRRRARVATRTEPVKLTPGEVRAVLDGTKTQIRLPWGNPGTVGDRLWVKERGYRGKRTRLLLKILKVRQERVQDMTEEDARAEGVESRDAFARLWKRTWDANPWVFCVEFRLLKRRH